MTTTIDDIIQEANAAFQEAKNLADRAITTVEATDLYVQGALGGIVRDYSGTLPNPANVIPGTITRPLLPLS